MSQAPAITIHAEPRIRWHNRYWPAIRKGLKAIGLDARVCSHRARQSPIAILLGTTCWRAIERCGGHYLLVDRCSVGNPNDYVSLVWNSHGRRGDHAVPAKPTAGRWRALGVELQPWRTSGRRRVLCGQTESYSPTWPHLPDWYNKVRATHFRPHPMGDNPTGLPRVYNWAHAGLAITLNSSVGVSAVIKGIPTVTMDEAAMAWDVTGHDDAEVIRPNRERWATWLAWTQWHIEEIAEGEPIRHLFEGRL